MTNPRLVRLIKSLSQTEKAYFQKQSMAFRGEQQPAYLLLYKALSSPEGPPETIREQFSKGRSAAYFPTLCQYLYEQLLDSLHRYHQQNSKRRKAEQQFQHAQLLIERSLYEDGLAKLQQVKKQCAKLQYLTLWLEALQLENHTIGLHFMSDGAQRKAAINIQSERLIRLLEQERFYFALYDRLYTHSKTEQSLRQPGEMEGLEIQMSHPWVTDESIPQTLRAKQLFNGIHYTFHTLKGDYELAYSYSDHNLRLWEAHPFLRQERFKDFLASYLNHINRCYQLRKTTQLRELLDGIGQLRPPTSEYADLLKIRKCLYEISFIELTQDYRRFPEVEAAAQALLQSSALNLSERRLLLYNMTYQCFVQEAFERALEYSVAFQQLPSSEGQAYLQRSSQLLNLLIHFELGNGQLLENTCSAHYTRFKRAGQLHQFEALFLRMIRKLAALIGQFRPNYDYEYYLKAFRELNTDPYERRAFEYLDIIRWLQAKQQGCSMLEVKNP
jgi:hypothetical protein